MKKYLFLPLVTAFAITGCNKNEQGNNAQPDKPTPGTTITSLLNGFENQQDLNTVMITNTTAGAYASFMRVDLSKEQKVEGNHSGRVLVYHSDFYEAQSGILYQSLKNVFRDVDCTLGDYLIELSFQVFNNNSESRKIDVKTVTHNTYQSNQSTSNNANYEIKPNQWNEIVYTFSSSIIYPNPSQRVVTGVDICFPNGVSSDDPDLYFIDNIVVKHVVPETNEGSSEEQDENSPFVSQNIDKMLLARNDENLVDIHNLTSFDLSSVRIKSEIEYMDSVKQYATPKWHLKPADLYHGGKQYNFDNALINISDIEEGYYVIYSTADYEGKEYVLSADYIDFYDSTKEELLWNDVSSDIENEFYVGGAWNNSGDVDPTTKINSELEKSAYLEVDYLQGQEVNGITGNFVRVTDGNKVVSNDGTETGDIARGHRFVWKPRHSKYYYKTFVDSYEMSFDFCVESDLWRYGGLRPSVYFDEESDKNFDITQDKIVNTVGVTFGEFRSFFNPEVKRIQMGNVNDWNHVVISIDDYAYGSSRYVNPLISFDDYYPSLGPTCVLAKQVTTYYTNFKIEKKNISLHNDTSLEAVYTGDTFDFSQNITDEEFEMIEDYRSKYYKVQASLRYIDSTGQERVSFYNSPIIDKSIIPSQALTAEGLTISFEYVVFFNNDKRDIWWHYDNRTIYSQIYQVYK